MRTRCFLILLFLLVFSGKKDDSFEAFRQHFVNGYRAMNIPALEYDYRSYFEHIAAIPTLQKQDSFFRAVTSQAQSIRPAKLTPAQLRDLAHIQYEVMFNQERIALELAWVKAGRNIPSGGLSSLPEKTKWYALFIKRFTGTETSPEEVFSMGQAEVARVKNEINRIMKQSSATDSAAFYRQLNDNRFFITDKQTVINGFQWIDSTVRVHLASFTGLTDIGPVYAMEWPEAGPHTPPGMYLNHTYNAYGKDVFQFNFYGGRYNRRAMEWLYMHEAIPGHHLQSVVRAALPPNQLQELFLYPGNFEGWACYVEYFGKELGLYNDPYSELGKWEWDLIRSARLVLDAGIHHYGWSRDEALAYWKRTIPNQDEIAEREVTRVTNWAGQALSYKVGAARLFDMSAQWQKKYPNKNIKEFYLQFLKMGMVPLSVAASHLNT